MAKGIWLGSAKENDTIFSEPLWFSTVKRLSDYSREFTVKKDTGGDGDVTDYLKTVLTQKGTYGKTGEKGSNND